MGRSNKRDNRKLLRNLRTTPTVAPLISLSSFIRCNLLSTRAHPRGRRGRASDAKTEVQARTPTRKRRRKTNRRNKRKGKKRKKERRLQESSAADASMELDLTSIEAVLLPVGHRSSMSSSQALLRSQSSGGTDSPKPLHRDFCGPFLTSGVHGMPPRTGDSDILYTRATSAPAQLRLGCIHTLLQAAAAALRSPRARTHLRTLLKAYVHMY